MFATSRGWVCFVEVPSCSRIGMCSFGHRWLYQLLFPNNNLLQFVDVCIWLSHPAFTQWLIGMGFSVRCIWNTKRRYSQVHILENLAQQRLAGYLLFSPQRRLRFTMHMLPWSCFVGWEQPTTSPKACAMLSPIDEKSDYAVCVHLVAVIMLAWFTTARTCVSEGGIGG